MVQYLQSIRGEKVHESYLQVDLNGGRLQSNKPYCENEY